VTLSTDCQVHQVFPDLLALKVSMDVMELLVFLVSLEIRVTEEENVLFVLLERRERKVLVDSLVCPVLKVIVVFLVFLVLLEILETMVFLDPLVKLVLLVLLVKMDFLVFLDKRVSPQD